MPRTSASYEHNQDLVESSLTAAGLINQDIGLILLITDQLDQRGAPHALTSNLRTTIHRIAPRINRIHTNLAAIHQLGQQNKWFT